MGGGIWGRYGSMVIPIEPVDNQLKMAVGGVGWNGFVGWVEVIGWVVGWGWMVGVGWMDGMDGMDGW